MTDQLMSQISHAKAEALQRINDISLTAQNAQQLIRPAQILDVIHKMNTRIIDFCQKAKEEAEPPFFAILKDRHGHEQDRITLTDLDPLDCDEFAERFGESWGFKLENDESGQIPDGAEDYSVTITDDPDGVRCWSSRNYMMAEE